MVALQWEPQIIAVAVMYLAGRLCKFDIQDWTSKQSSRRWWEQFVHDVPVEVLEGNDSTATLVMVYLEYNLFSLFLFAPASLSITKTSATKSWTCILRLSSRCPMEE